MIKTCAADDTTFDAPLWRLVKQSARGVTGSDRAEFADRAAAAFLQDLPKHLEKLAAGEVLVHGLAIGATEHYGPNRNGDGFRAATCRECHPTFVKFARLYRGHKNKDPGKSYGRVIASAFNEPMQRVELLLALNGNAKVAAANGGLVADRELEKLASNQPLALSMGCLIHHDVCSYCGNEAPTAREYCEGTERGGKCRAGGLRKKMGAIVRVDGDLHHLHADNPNPRFFDISHVQRPADRIAYVTSRIKAAGDGQPLQGDVIAAELDITAPLDVLLDARGGTAAMSPGMLKWAVAMSEPRAVTDNGLTAIAGACVTDYDVPPDFREKFADYMAAMSRARVCLPPAAFLEHVVGLSAKKAAALTPLVAPLASRAVIGVCRGEPLRTVTAHTYRPSSRCTSQQQQWANGVDGWSLEPQRLKRASQTATIRGNTALVVPPVIDAEPDRVFSLAAEYASYKLAALAAISDTPEATDESALTASLAVLQNHICPAA